MLLAVGLCAVLRVGLYAVRDRLDHVPAPSIHPQLIAREEHVIRQATVKPRVVLMGDSVMLYGVNEDRLASLMGLAPGEVANLGIESGRAWDALVLMRRNSQFFAEVELVIFNAAFNQVTQSSVAKRLPHFYRFSTLAEKWRVDSTRDRAAMLLDAAWPVYSERRELSTWLEAFADRVPVQGVSLRPAWEPGNLAKMLARKQEVAVSPSANAASYGPIPVSELHVKLLDDFVRHWREREVQVLLVCMPVAPSLAAVLNRAPVPPEFASFQRRLESLTGEGVALADWRTDTALGLSDATDYMDEGHLTPNGAARMSEVIADYLNRIGYAVKPQIDSPGALSRADIP